jgi:hypothetical protein
MRTFIFHTGLLVIVILGISCGSPAPPQPFIRSDEYAVDGALLQRHFESNMQSANKYAEVFKKNRRSIDEIRLSILPVYDCTAPPYDSTSYDTTIDRPMKQHDRAATGTPAWLREEHTHHTMDIFSYFRGAVPPENFRSLRIDFDSVKTQVVKLDSLRLPRRLPVRLLSAPVYAAVFSRDTISSFYNAELAKLMLFHHWWYRFSRVGLDASRTYAVVFYDLGQPGGGGTFMALLHKQGSQWVVIREAMSMYV